MCLVYYSTTILYYYTTRTIEENHLRNLVIIHNTNIIYYRADDKLISILYNNCESQQASEGQKTDTHTHTLHNTQRSARSEFGFNKRKSSFQQLMSVITRTNKPTQNTHIHHTHTTTTTHDDPTNQPVLIPLSMTSDTKQNSSTASTKFPNAQRFGLHVCTHVRSFELHNINYHNHYMSRRIYTKLLIDKGEIQSEYQKYLSNKILVNY